MRHLLAVALVVILSGTAVSAQESDDAPPGIPLSYLTSAARAKLAAIIGLGEVPGADRLAMRRADVARLDLFIGRLRVEAERTVRSELSRAAADLVLSLPRDTDEIAIAGAISQAGIVGVDSWTAEVLAPQWLALAAVLDDLRSVADAIGPERVCPVLGTNWFTDTWGEDRPGSRSHKGIDMMGRRGIPVQAIEDGVVVQANWHREGGRQIYVRADSTGDVYYYAHLDYWEKWIWTGTRVEAGDVMGRLGSSGNASSPHLHFGWMPGSLRVDLENLQNPYPLLVEICPDNDPPEWFLAQEGG